MRQEIIDLINQNKSLKAISKTLNIDENQVWSEIQQMINYGYNIDFEYTYNSDIYFKFVKSFEQLPKNQIEINIPRDVKEVKFIAMSDLHIGDVDSSIRLTYPVYDFAVKNNINSIFLCGDQIQSNYDKKLDLQEVESQVDYFVEHYPFDENIINYMILGNHDYRSLHLCGFDISKRINSLRYDIVPAGYGISNVKLKNDFIILKHNLEYIDLPEAREDSFIVLSGHGHIMRTDLKDRLYICVPSLSHSSPDKKRENVPGFVSTTLYFDKKTIEGIKVEHYLVEPKIIQASEVKCKVKKLFKETDNVNR